MFQKVKGLSLNLIVYGMGDVAVQVAGFLLLPLFTGILTPSDYGVLGQLMSVEILAKIVFRFGVDASFMRMYYDCPDERSRQSLASTIFLFLLVVNGAVLTGALAGTPFLAQHLFQRPGYETALAIVLVNMFVGGFFFIPFHLLRIERRSMQFSALTFSRAASTTILRIVLIAGFRLGVLGFLLADIVVTIAFAGVLARLFARVIRPTFSFDLLKEALRFGLPRVPHGAAQQVIGPGTDPALLRAFLPMSNAVERDALIGRYNIGASFGATLKLFLSAFEYAWAPFYFATMKEADARQTFSRITTYGIAVLVFLTAGLSAIAADLVRLATHPGYFQAARVIPWIAIGVTLQGVYLLTSIGLNITKRTGYYPIATVIAAGVDVGCNMVLIPRFGIMGPAYSNVIAYAVLAIVSMIFSQRFYPVSCEWRRLVKIVVAGVVSYLVARVLIPAGIYSPFGVVGRGALVIAVFPACLAFTGFFQAHELARLRLLTSRIVSARIRRVVPVPGDGESRDMGADEEQAAAIQAGDTDEIGG